jgi:outer membrane protein OmpA-like peptidoglycan-associated protein
MSPWYRTWARAPLLLAGGVAIAMSDGPVQAQPVSERQILDILTKSGTTSLAAPDQMRKDREFIDTLRQRRTRSLTLGERKRIATIARRQPEVNLEIHFDFGSAAITPEALPQLRALGRALSSRELADAAILLAGHTDARGTDAYNQDLSERRASAVHDFLVRNFGISPGRLTAIGYGEQDLADKRNPYDAGNRRVQIVNLDSRQQAGTQR